MRPRTRAAAAVLTLTLAGLPVPAAAAVAAGDPPAGATYTVTLLTGDVVTARTRPGGCPIATVRPAVPGRLTSVRCDPRGHLHVLPADAAPRVGRELDPALFDVTALIENGYDDARSADLPLIAERGGAGLGLRLAGGRTLDSIGAVAVRHLKTRSATVRASLADPPSGRAGPATARAPLATPAGRVWLDRRVRAQLSPAGSRALSPGGAGRRAQSPAGAGSRDQVGAPAAWAGGWTGRGVRVAVLDSGIDAAHPDLRGRVVESADFTGTGGTADLNGHGTHVASIVAGTGAASQGRYTGVAPGAELVVGRILGADGTGSTSDTIAAMEWAAPRAAVVNLSVTETAPSDGTDPLSHAVDRLTADHGTLFVVAAGNLGPDVPSVAAPGAAAAALTVGAVDAAGVLAQTSGRGPMPGGATKPEILAPGADIVAARAEGTGAGRIIDGNYTAESGTSMAAPHVAGAAAVLCQRHPAWSAAALRAALVGAAEPVAAGAGADGAGRLHVDRALAGIAPGEAAPHLGVLPFPQSGRAEAALTWRNAGSRVRAGELSVQAVSGAGDPAPAGAVTLSADAVTVRPGGTATATLRIDRRRFADRPGRYRAVVTARWAGQTSRTTVSFVIEPPAYDLTVRASALPGAEAAYSGAYAQVVNLDDPLVPAEWVQVPEPGAGVTVRLPAGRYSVMGEVQDLAPGANRLALAGDPDVALSGDTVVELAGARARPVDATVVGVATETRATAVLYEQSPRVGRPWWAGVYAGLDPEQEPARLLVVPGPGTRAGAFTAYQFSTLDGPGRRYDLVRVLGADLAADPHHRVTVAEQAGLARIDQRFHRLDVPGSGAVHQRYGRLPGGGVAWGSTAGDLPPSRMDLVTPGVPWWEEASYSGVLDDPVVIQEPLRHYRPGERVEKRWLRQPLRPDWFEPGAELPSICMPEPVRRTSGNLRVAVADLVDAHGRFDCLGANPAWTSAVDRRLALWRDDGTRIGAVAGSRADFPVARDEAGYRLTYDLDTGGLAGLSTRVMTAWTFRSRGAPDAADRPVALLAIDYQLGLDAGNHPDGTPATFAVRQTPGVPAQRITSLSAEVSTDDGGSWAPVAVVETAPGRFRASLPAEAVVSLRVSASGAAGSGVRQTIIRAYRAS